MFAFEKHLQNNFDGTVSDNRVNGVSVSATHSITYMFYYKF